MAGNKANRLELRYRSTGDPGDLAAAIDLGEQALPASEGTLDRAKAAGNQADRWTLRFAASESAVDASRAIALDGEALAIMTPGSPERPGAALRLAWLLSERYEISGDAADLAQAIARCEEAQRPPAGPEEREAATDLLAELVTWRMAPRGKRTAPGPRRPRASRRVRGRKGRKKST